MAARKPGGFDHPLDLTGFWWNDRQSVDPSRKRNSLLARLQGSRSPITSTQTAGN
jgi:hypothetical protein